MLIDFYKKERERLAENVCEYDLLCYDEALKAFELLCKNASGYSMDVTMKYLNRMTSGLPMLPIEEKDFSLYFERKVIGSHQCPRMSSLFMKIDNEGNVRYSDVNRVTTRVVSNGTTWHNGLITRIVDEMYPITLPYMPTGKKFVANVEEFLFDPANGDYDAIRFVSLIKPDGTEEPIGRCFMELGGEFVEVSTEMFDAALQKHLSEKKDC